MFMNLLHDMGDLLEAQAAPTRRRHHLLDVAQELLRLGPVGIDLLHGTLPGKVQGNILLIQAGTIEVRHLRPTARQLEKETSAAKKLKKKGERDIDKPSNHIHFSSASRKLS